METSYYEQKYKKKDGSFSIYKKQYVKKGTPKTGRPKMIKTQILMLLKKINKEQQQQLLTKLENLVKAQELSKDLF